MSCANDMQSIYTGLFKKLTGARERERGHVKTLRSNGQEKRKRFRQSADNELHMNFTDTVLKLHVTKRII